MPSATSSTGWGTPTSWRSTARPPTTCVTRRGPAGRTAVYLSGIVPDLPREELSDHLLSRLEVEEILSSADCSVLTLRASMVIGAGSTS